MTGSYFFHAIKTDRLLREHFEAWVKEQRAQYFRELAGVEPEYLLYRCQGKVQALDNLLIMLEQSLNLPPDDLASTEFLQRGPWAVDSKS